MDKVETNRGAATLAQVAPGSGEGPGTQGHTPGHTVWTLEVKMAAARSSGEFSLDETRLEELTLVEVT